MHAHYLFTVKANQPTLLDRCQRLPWHRVPVLDCTRDRGHGRIELRTLKAVTVGHFGFPRAAQVLQVTRKTRGLHTKRWRTVIVYVITSLPFEQASPARLTDLLRGHWTIENGLHWVRDVTFAEDGSQLRAGTARRSWPACATWSSAPSAAPGRSTSPPPCATTPATHSDPSRPLGLPSGEPGATQERPERWVLGDRWWEQRCRRPWWCRYSSAMKAAVHTSYGPPEVVRITEVDKPTPQGQRGAGQGARHDGEPDRLRLAGGQALINRFFTGLLRPRVTVLGSEFAGVVEGVGRRVTSFEVSDRVFGFSGSRFGAHAEYLAIPEDGFVATMPANLTYEQAAPSTEGSHYALSAIRAAKVRSGHDVLVNGATGAIGSAAVQLLKQLGAAVTAVCGTEHVELVKDLGADRVIDYTAEAFTKTPSATT
jgi:hypothetical protein